jgi:hypothetical protein
MYRGPIGVSSSRTPSVSFSIHMTWPTWKRRPTPPLPAAGHYCTRDGAMESNLFIFAGNSFAPPGST